MIDSFTMTVTDQPQVIAIHTQAARTLLVEVIGANDVIFGGPNIDTLEHGFRRHAGDSINGTFMLASDQLYVMCDPGKTSTIQGIRTGV